MRSAAAITAFATIASLQLQGGLEVRAAEPAKSEYGVLADRPDTGSLLRREVVTGSPIPVNKRYR